MGALGLIGKIIAFPFKLIFGRVKKKEPVSEEILPKPTQLPPTISSTYTPETVATENLKAKVDLMLSQVDSLKLEYEALNQRIQNIERMVREIYAMAKS